MRWPKPGVHTHKTDADVRDVYSYTKGGRTRLGAVAKIEGKWRATPRGGDRPISQEFPTMSSAVGWLIFWDRIND